MFYLGNIVSPVELVSQICYGNPTHTMKVPNTDSLFHRLGPRAASTDVPIFRRDT